MRKRLPNIVRVLMALALVAGLVAVTAGTASAATAITIVPSGNYTGTGTYADPYTGGTPPGVVYGSTVVITGTELTTAHGTLATITWDGGPLTTVPAAPTVLDPDDPPNPDGDQYLSATFAIPEATAGTHFATATDGVTSAGLATAPDYNRVFFNVGQRVIVSPTQGTPGTTISVTGYGFAGSVSVDIKITGTIPPVGTAVTDTKGTFSGTFVIPATGTGATPTVTATDGSANSGTATLVVNPLLTLIPTSGLAGSTVTIKGSGFGNTTVTEDVMLRFAGRNDTAGTDLSSVTTGTAITDTTVTYNVGVRSSAGAFQVSMVVPAASTGGTKTISAHTIDATKVTGTVSSTRPATADTTVPTRATASYVVSALALTVTPSSGKINDTVTITGGGFTPSATVNTTNGITVLGVNATSITGSSDTNGIVTASCRIPAVRAGTHTVVVTAGVARIGSFTIVAPTVSISPSSGPIGTMVTLSGNNWNRISTITITGAGLTTALTANTDTNGAFTTTSLVIPSGAVPGENVISLSDTIGNSATVVFTVPSPGITLSPSTGPSGTTVTMTGTGMPAYSAVTARFAGIAIGLTPVAPVVQADGSFECTFLVPASQLVTQIVVATASTKSASATFAVSLPPTTVEIALASVSDQLVRVWALDAPTQTWLMYDPAAVAVSDLAQLVQGQGYYVKVTADCTLTYGVKTYSLYEGWNLIGWLG